jgi:hypothetical protein
MAAGQYNTSGKRILLGINVIWRMVSHASYPPGSKPRPRCTARSTTAYRIPDQIIDASTALTVQAEALRTWSVVGWSVASGVPQFPGRYVARLLAGDPLPYVLVADTLEDDMHALLPGGLTLVPRLPPDQPEIVELWFVA